MYLCKGDVQKAIPALERSVAFCQDANLRYLYIRAASDLGAAYTLAGRVAEALPLLEQAVQQATLISVQSGQSLRVASLSEATLLAGRLEEALSLAQQALELARTHKERGNEAWRSLSFWQSISTSGARMIRLSPLRQRALALPRPAGRSPARAGEPLPRPSLRVPRATIVGRSTASDRPWRPSTGRGATSAFGQVNLPAVQCSA